MSLLSDSQTEQMLSDRDAFRRRIAPALVLYSNPRSSSLPDAYDRSQLYRFVAPGPRTIDLFASADHIQSLEVLYGVHASSSVVGSYLSVLQHLPFWPPSGCLQLSHRYVRGHTSNVSIFVMLSCYLKLYLCLIMSK